MVAITLGDTPLSDGFGRVRVSEQATIFDSKLLNGKTTDVWSEAGTAASPTYDTNRVHMTVAAGEYSIRQTKMRFNYLPGKSHLVLITAVMGDDHGCTKRVGYFNSSTVAPYTASLDGVWFESDGTDMYWVISRGGTQTKVAQADWSTNRMDGGQLAPSIDLTKPQILWMDLEWLGVGRARCGFVVAGQFFVAHEFRNSNRGDIAQPYIDSPNHSIRYEIRSTTGAGELIAICSSVQSEGGYDLVGNLFSGDRGISGYATGNNTNIHPLFSMRLRSDRPDGTVIVINGSVLPSSTTDFRWALLLNPTVAGVDAASWVSVGGNSSVEYDISRNTTNTLTGGTQIDSGYIKASQQGAGNITVDLNSAVRPGIAIDGTQDELVLAIQNLTNTGQNYHAGVGWREPL